jgi:hypothetical protein
LPCFALIGQASRLVEVAVVRPTIQRSKALRTGRRAASPIGRAIRTGAVPRHADEQRAIVPPVGGPPRLGPRHELAQIPHDRIEIELHELGGIVEVGTKRVGGRGILVQHCKVELVGPPIAVRPGTARWLRAVRDRTLRPGFDWMTFHDADLQLVTAF